MKRITSLPWAMTFAAVVGSFAITPTVMAAEPSAATVQVVGEKKDSGLGDLPHYSQWADPTGKNPMRAATQAAPANKAERSLERDGVKISAAN